MRFFAVFGFCPVFSGCYLAQNSNSVVSITDRARVILYFSLILLIVRLPSFDAYQTLAPTCSDCG